MNQSDSLKKLIYKDCQKAMRPALLLHMIDNLLSGVISIYFAGVLGDFAYAVFRLDFSYGISNLCKFIFCLGFSVLIIPFINTCGEVVMFRNCLQHDRLIYSRFWDKKYEEAIKIEEGEAEYRLEMDPIDLRIYWIQIGEKILTLPVMLCYVLYKSLPVSPLLTAIVFLLALLKLLVPMAVKKVQAKYDLEKRDYDTAVRNMETDITGSPYQVKLLGLSEPYLNRLDNMFRVYYKKVLTKSLFCTVLSDKVLNLLDTFCTLAILFTGAVMVSNGSVTAGAIAAMMGYFSVFNDLIGKFDFIIRSLPLIDNVAERIKVLYDGAEEKSDNELDTVHSITAQNLSFSFAGKKIFENKNFIIYAGEKVVLCGENGSGKSTFLKVFSGLFQKYQGKLLLDDKELRAVNINSWRKLFAYVEQTPYLFSGTVRENIHLGDLQASDEQVTTVMENVGISHLSDRKVSNTQNDLSGGEKQKISIARALLKDTSLLVMDEPDNHLDQATLEWLKNFIKQSDKTILYISHDEELVKLADIKISF